MFRAEQVDRLSPAVRSAIWEDAAGCGAWMDAPLATRLCQIGGNGRPLPRRLAGTMEREFASDLSRIRLHAGPGVDEMAALFRAHAFCVGTDVFFGSAVLNRTDGTPRLDVLRHELAHVIYRPEPEKLRFWNHDVHGELTEKACRAFSSELDRLVKLKNLDISREELIKGLKIASSNMDVRHRFGHPLDTAAYWLKSKAKKIFKGMYTAGEGPRHGEGENYQHDEHDDKVIKDVWHHYGALNLAEQRKWIGVAKREFESDLDSWIDDLVPTIRGVHLPELTPFDGREQVGPISLNEKPWVKSLANAFHVAQDRGSHREGVKGYGHDDARCSTGWSPDDPKNHDHTEGTSWKRCNKAAYNKAANNSFDVLNEFLQAIHKKTGIRPHGVPRLPLECSVSRRVAEIQARDATDPPVEDSATEPCEIYISPYPNPFNRTMLGRPPHPCRRIFESSHALRLLASRAKGLPANRPFGRLP